MRSTAASSSTGSTIDFSSAVDQVPAILGSTHLLSSGASGSETAFALDARAGTALIDGRDHDLTLSLEGSSGFFADDTLFSAACLVAWKWY